MECECSHGALIAQVEYHIVIGLHAILKPFDFRRISHIGIAHHQAFATRVKAKIMAIEIVDGGIGESQGSCIGTSDIAEVSTIGEVIGTLQVGRREVDIWLMTVLQG